jgi:hypothetical protein
VTAVAVHRTDENVVCAGYANGRIVSIDLRTPSKSGPGNVDAPMPNERVIKIASNTGSRVTFLAATAKGSVMQWESLDVVAVLGKGSDLAGFDVHPTVPMAVLAPVGSVPVICDLEMRVVHQLKGAEAGAVCAFHPALTVVVCVNANGDVYQYELK